MAALALFIWLSLSPHASGAQAEPRDYSISPPPVSYSSDGARAIITFTVSNQGGAAREASQIVVTENQSGRVEVRESLPPLAAGESREFSIELPLAAYREGDIFFKIEAGIDAYELAESEIARDNAQLFRINRAAAGAAAGTRSAAGASPEPAPYNLFIPLVNVGVNFLEDGVEVNERRYGANDILVALGALALALFCLWLLSLILRLIFRRPPRFEQWQPPYAVNNWHDPNSALGRRQSWQYHAQNSAIASAGAPDQVRVVKRLLDKRGRVLGGWQIQSMRSEQYDVYGRINKTETVMPRKLVRRLNRALGRGPGDAAEALQKAIAPIARRMSKLALAPVERQNLMLPMALDIRFAGAVDDIVIQFELYQFREGGWRLLDQWQPELGPVGEHVPEQFTFTLKGQLSGESKKAYRGRLREDLTRLLAGLVQPAQAGEEDRPPAQPASSTDALPPKDEFWQPPPDDETNPGPPVNG